MGRCEALRGGGDTSVERGIHVRWEDERYGAAARRADQPLDVPAAALNELQPWALRIAA